MVGDGARLGEVLVDCGYRYRAPPAIKHRWTLAPPRHLRQSKPQAPLVILAQPRAPSDRIKNTINNSNLALLSSRPGSPARPREPGPSGWHEIGEIADALTLVLEGSRRADEIFPSPIFAVIFRSGTNRQCRVSGRRAWAAACIGEGDGCGVSAGDKPAGVHRKGVGHCGRHSAHNEGGGEPTRNPRDRIGNAAARGTQLIRKRRGREDLPLDARGRDAGRRRDLQRPLDKDPPCPGVGVVERPAGDGGVAVGGQRDGKALVGPRSGVPTPPVPTSFAPSWVQTPPLRV
jgi:hypothetical protein